MDIKMEFVFFDDLGFGWLVDADTLQKMRDKESIQQIMIQQSLADLLRKREPL